MQTPRERRWFSVSCDTKTIAYLKRAARASLGVTSPHVRVSLSGWALRVLVREAEAVLRAQRAA